MKINKNRDIEEQLKLAREEIPKPDDRLKSRLYQDIPREYTPIKLPKMGRVRFQLAAAAAIIVSIVIMFVTNQQESSEFPEDYFKPTIVVSLIDEEPQEDTFTPTMVIKITEKDLFVQEEDHSHENQDI
jgi:hypothetical protein